MTERIVSLLLVTATRQVYPLRAQGVGQHSVTIRVL